MRFLILTVVASIFSVSSNGQDLPANEYFDSVLMAEARQSLHNKSGNSTNFLIMVDKVETHIESKAPIVEWEVQAWLGKDLHRAWFKTKGKRFEDRQVEQESEIQLLYSRAISPFWDMQIGWRHDFTFVEERDYFAIGFQGLAPQWFDMDLGIFFADDGEFSARIEGEYDWLLTQKLVLQPSVELDFSIIGGEENTSDKFIRTLVYSLRLRYEVARSFAPYIGVKWTRDYGNTRERVGHVNKKMVRSAEIIAGLSFWF